MPFAARGLKETDRNYSGNTHMFRAQATYPPIIQIYLCRRHYPSTFKNLTFDKHMEDLGDH